MYYILLVLALILVYSLVTKVLSSIFKMLLIFFGTLILGIVIYIFVTSNTRPVELFNQYIVEDFTVRKVE